MKWIHSSIALAAMLFMSGCAGAAFNRIELTMTRNITVGQELVDLHTAHEKGIISDEEYAKAKNNVLNILGQISELGETK